MQQIQWYPGHMYKASKEVKEVLPEMDLIIEILDARIPFSSENPMLAELRGDKPCIKVLNKSDLADPVMTERWQTYLEQEKSIKTLALTNQNPDKIQQLITLCRKMIPLQSDSIKVIQALVVGIPNVGKSTLINILADRKIAKTGNEPAVTRMQQRIKLTDDIILFDSPGLLWPNVENRNSGYRLATTGAIKDTAIDHEDVAFFAASILLEYYPDYVPNRYQLENTPQSELELLEAIGTRRGCLRSGGHVDLDKTAKILLTELRAGTLGRMTLETPEITEKERAELVIIRAQKAAKQSTRKKKRKRSTRR